MGRMVSVGWRKKRKRKGVLVVVLGAVAVGERGKELGW